MVVPQSSRTQAPLSPCSIILHGPIWLQEHQASYSSPEAAYISAEAALQKGPPQKLFRVPLSTATWSQPPHVTILAGRGAALNTDSFLVPLTENEAGWKLAVSGPFVFRSTL